MDLDQCLRIIIGQRREHKAVGKSVSDSVSRLVGTLVIPNGDLTMPLTYEINLIKAKGLKLTSLISGTD